MDEVALLLDRAVGDVAATAAVPPVGSVRAAARRRSAARALASVVVVLFVVVGCVVGLAGMSRASQWPPSTVASAAYAGATTPSAASR